MSSQNHESKNEDQMLEDLRVYASKNQGKENDTVDALIEKRHFNKNVMIFLQESIVDW